MGPFSHIEHTLVGQPVLGRGSEAGQKEVEGGGAIGRPNLDGLPAAWVDVILGVTGVDYASEVAFLGPTEGDADQG